MPLKNATRRNTQAVMGKKKNRGKTQKVKVTKTVAVKPMRDTQKAQVLALMRKMIGKETENKEVGLVVESTLHNSPIGSADCSRILPDIGNGVDGSSRLGDRVKPTRLVVRGIVSLSDENPDTKPMYVRVIVAAQKDIKNSQQIAAGGVDTAHLLRSAIPGASEVAFNGTRQRLNFRVNENKFRVFADQQFLITPVSALSGNAGIGSQFKFIKEIPCPATLTFDEGSGDTPNNFAPFLAIGYAYADGSAADTVQTRISTEVYSLLTYEDA